MHTFGSWTLQPTPASCSWSRSSQLQSISRGPQTGLLILHFKWALERADRRQCLNTSPYIQQAVWFLGLCTKGWVISQKTVNALMTCSDNFFSLLVWQITWVSPTACRIWCLSCFCYRPLKWVLHFTRDSASPSQRNFFLQAWALMRENDLTVCLSRSTVYLRKNQPCLNSTGRLICCALRRTALCCARSVSLLIRHTVGGYRLSLWPQPFAARHHYCIWGPRISDWHLKRNGSEIFVGMGIYVLRGVLQ